MIMMRLQTRVLSATIISQGYHVQVIRSRCVFTSVHGIKLFNDFAALTVFSPDGHLFQVYHPAIKLC